MNQISPFAFGTTPNFDSLVVENFISGANGGPLHLLADPVASLDAATKNYVDDTVASSIPTTSPTPPANPAPNDMWYDAVSGQLYIWYVDPNSSQWVIANNTGIQDAPIGAVAYGRQDRSWVPVLPLIGGAMTGPLILAMDPTTYFMAATKGYVDVNLQNYLPLTGGTLSGQLLLTSDPTVAHGAATKQYVDLHSGLVPISDVAPANPIPGQLWFDSRSVQLYVWYVDGSGVWVQTNAPAFTDGSAGAGGGGAGFPEAPVTGRIYGRDGATQSWAPVLPILAGATNQLAGPLFLANNAPVFDNEAASKRFVEDAVATGSLWQGGYIVATNNPDLSTVTPLLNGYSWTAITQDPIVPELLAIPLPGIAVGTLIYNGDLLRWDQANGLWFAIRGSGITRNEADALYVLRSGDLMTGILYLAADPTQPTEASTKRYVDTKDVFVSNLPPVNPFPGQLWYDMANPNLYIWLVDPTSAQWVIAVNPTATTAALPLRADPFIFPDNPADGETVVTPAGASYRWDAATSRWEYVPQQEHFVNLTGDTMTGWLNIEGTDNAAVVFKRAQIGPGPFFDGQWGIGADWAGNVLGGTGFKIARFDPTGTVIDSPISISEMDGTITIGGEGINLNQKLLVGLPVPTIPSQATPMSYTVAKTGDVMTGPLTINNPTTSTALVINNPTPGLGALEIRDNSLAHSVIISNTGGGAALIIDDDTNSTAMQITNNGAGSGLVIRHAENFGHPALELFGGNRNSAGAGGNPQIALSCIGGGRPQWIASWTDVGGGGGITAEGMGFYTNDHAGGDWIANKLFCGAFNSATATQGRFIAPFGSVTNPGIIFGNGPTTGSFTLDQTTGFFRPSANAIGVSLLGTELLRFAGGGGVMFDHDATGVFFYGGGGIYKRSSTGVVIRQNVGNQPLQVEDNNGSNLRAVIDTTSGDARYLLRTGGVVNGQLDVSRPINNIALSVNDGYLRLYKGNSTQNVDWPSINYAINGGRDAGANAYIRCRQTGPYSYYGTNNDFEFGSGRGGYGVQRGVWTSNPGGGWVDLNVQRNVVANGVILTSDTRLKEDIRPIEDVDEAFEALEPVRFRWKPQTVEVPLAAPEGRMFSPRAEPERLNYGILADSVMTDAIEYTERGKAYDLAAVVAVLVAKVKQLESRLAS